MANTPNFNLYKPNRADNDVEVDVSLADNFTKIDTEIKNRKDTLDAHITNPNAHTSENISHADGSVKTTLENHEERLTNEEIIIGDLDTRLSGTETSVTDHETRIEVVETSTSAIDARVTDIEVLGIDKLAPNLEGRITTLESDIEGVLAPATFDSIGQQGYTFDEYRIGYVANKLNEIVVSVTTFGAKGDGTTDDTTSIKDALLYLASGGTLLFPKGTYIISSTLDIPSNTVLVGFGATLKLVNNAVNDPRKATMLWVSGVSNIKILTLNFDGNISNQTPVDTEHNFRGIHIENASNIVISNNKFSNFKHQCIQIGTGSYTSNGAYNLLVDGNTFTDVWSALQSIESDSKHVFFTNNYVYNCQEHGIVFYPGNSYVTVSGNIIKNCGLRNGPYPNPDPETPPNGTYNYGSCIRLLETIYGTISDNIVENPRYGGIRVVTNTPTMSYQRAQYVTVSNNIVMGGSRLGAQGHGIEVYGDNVIVNGNIVKDFTHISAATGLNLNGSNITAKGNQVKNANNGIISLGSYHSISENTIIDGGNFAITLGGASSLLSSNAIGNIIESQNVVCTRGVYLQANASNCLLSANVFVNVQNNIVNNGVQTQFNNPVYYATSIPSTGTFNKGDRVVNTNPFIGNAKGWICVTAGTFGTLSSVTGSITTGTPTLTVNSATNLAFGNYITIAGVTGTKRIIGISGTTITLDSNADATVSGAAVAYGVPLLQSEGNL